MVFEHTRFVDVTSFWAISSDYIVSVVCIRWPNLIIRKFLMKRSITHITNKPFI